MSTPASPATDLPLRDIHLPDSISLWPLAPGWWMVAALLILIALTLYIIRKRYGRNRLRKQALAELARVERAFADHQNGLQLAADLSALLRRVCISRFPAIEVAGLTGQAWLAFLNSVYDAFDAQNGTVLISSQYQKQSDINDAALIAACRQWLEQLQPASEGRP